MVYGIEAEGGLFKKVRVQEGQIDNVSANNLVANNMRGENVRITGTGQFTDLSVTRNRIVRIHHHLSDGNVQVYSGAWNMSGDLDIRYGCVNNCSGSCTGQCTGCSGSCSGTCTARCSNNCSGCSGSCSGSCTARCGGGCSGSNHS